MVDRCASKESSQNIASLEASQMITAWDLVLKIHLGKHLKNIGEYDEFVKGILQSL